MVEATCNILMPDGGLWRLLCIVCTLFRMAGNRIAISVIQPLHSKAAFSEISCFIFRNVEDRHMASP